MQEVCLTILAVLVVGGFSSPLDYEEEYPWTSLDITKQQPGLRIGLVNSEYYWPEATMYYTIHPSFSPTEAGIIRAAMDEIERVTCVQIKPRTDQANYLEIESARGIGCRSYNGMIGGPQLLYLEKSVCFDSGKGAAIHELLHALGLLDTHKADDRDKYVEVVESNIDLGNAGAFLKYPPSDASDFGFGYDYGSIMHPFKFAYAIDPYKETIIPKNDPKTPIGQREKLSDSDIGKLKKMYRC